MSNLAVNDAGDVLMYDGQGWKPAPMAANDAGDKVVFDGAAWKPHAELVGAAKGAQPQGRSDALANAIGGGALQQFGDEATAAVRAAAPGVANFMMRGPALQRDESIGGSPTPQTVSTAPTYGERYTEELARQRAQTGADAKAYPAMTTAGNIGGSVGSLALALPAALPAGGGLIANTARAALTGSIFGGASGFGEGEGGFDNRMLNATKGAAVGGVLGGTLPGIAKALGYAYSKAAPPILNKISDVAEQFVPKITPRSVSAAAPDGGQVAGDSLATRIADTTRVAAGGVQDDAAIARIALELARSGGTRQARTALTDLGEGAMIADTSKGAERLANLGYILPGSAPDKYKAAFELRNRATGTRFENELPGAPPIAEAQDYLKAYKKQTGSDVYDPVLRGGQFNVSPEMQAVMQKRPAVRDAMAQIEADAKEYGEKLTPAEVAHLVKQTLNKNTEAAFQGGKVINKDMVLKAGEDWERALYQANPGIQAADEAYARAASLSNPKTGEGFLQRGQRFMRAGTSEAATEASPSALARDLPQADLRQRQAFQVGSTNTLRDIAQQGPKSTRRLADKLSEGDFMRQKLEQIYDPATAARIIKQGETEKAFAATANKVMGGSDTAQRGASLADEFALGSEIPKGPLSLAKALIQSYQKLRQPNEAVRGKIADLIANPQAAENAQTLALVEALLRRQSETRNFSSGAVGGAGGSQAGSP